MTTLPVKPYSPKCQVTIWTDAKGKIDLTARDLLSLSTKRSINTPTGAWDLLLTGRKIDGVSYLDIIRPQDYVEIRFARAPSRGGLPIVMRGFVDNCNETTASGERRVSINGRDFGKLLLKFQIYYLNEVDPTAALLKQAGIEPRLTFPTGIVTPTQFVTTIRDNIIAPNLDLLRGNRAWIPDMAVAVNVPDRFAVNGLAVQPFTGAVWNLLSQFASKPWIECFLTDTDTAPTLVYRFAPLRSYGGTNVASFQPSVDVSTITAADIETQSIGVSDNEIYTYYFTYPQYNLLNRTDFKGEGLALGRNPVMDETRIKRYGFLPLELSTPLIPSLVPEAPGAEGLSTDNSLDLAVELNTWLLHAFTDNDKYYNGSLSIKGGGGIQPGTYVEVSDLRRRYYVAGVSHSFSLAEGRVRTSLDVTRGHPIHQGGRGGGRAPST